MIRKPCTDRSFFKKLTLFTLSLIFMWSTVPAAEPTHHFEIKVPERIQAGVEATFTVTAHRADKSEIKNKHTVNFIVSSPNKTEEHQIKIRNGSGEIKLSFADAGEYLISVIDKNDANLMRSGSFKVGMAPLKNIKGNLR